jgi:hypothetical protein
MEYIGCPPFYDYQILEDTLIGRQLAPWRKAKKGALSKRQSFSSLIRELYPTYWGSFHEENKCLKSLIISKEQRPRKISSQITVLPWQNFCEMLWAGDIL